MAENNIPSGFFLSPQVEFIGVGTEVTSFLMFFGGARILYYYGNLWVPPPMPRLPPGK